MASAPHAEVVVMSMPPREQVLQEKVDTVRNAILEQRKTRLMMWLAFQPMLILFIGAAVLIVIMSR